MLSHQQHDMPCLSSNVCQIEKYARSSFSNGRGRIRQCIVKSYSVERACPSKMFTFLQRCTRPSPVPVSTLVAPRHDNICGIHRVIVASHIRFPRSQDRLACQSADGYACVSPFSSLIPSPSFFRNDHAYFRGPYHACPNLTDRIFIEITRCASAIYTISSRLPARV